MADDLHRDLLPVRENSYVESFRGSIIDPRERLIVSKLNRSDLEDKYLRLFEDYLELKKLYNSQEDKIKRLSTKLMRVCTTPRLLNCGTYNNGNNERNRITSLVLENSKLKDKINILRNQILSHRVLARPSSQNRRLQVCHSSAITSYRSDGPIKVGTCQNFISDRENNEIHNYITRIKELEIQRKKMMTRISELENKLDLCEAGNQKEKIAENVEYIRVWRQMKLQNENFIETEAKNKSLIKEIEALRSLLEETSKNHGEITAKFLAEKELASELKEQVSRTQSFEVDLRQRDEKIRDLTSELKILQEHKNQMVELSRRNSGTEIENGQLKQKLSDIMADNIHLKTTFNNEQTNIAALQTVNAQLREKLQDLQKSVDILTVKQNAFEKQAGLEQTHKSPSKSKLADRFNNPVLICECTADEKEVRLGDAHNPHKVQENNEEKKTNAKKTHNYAETSMQTDFRLSDWKKDKPKEDKACSTDEFVGRSSKNSVITHEKTTLTPEEILKLLDDAQINSPLTSQTASKIGPLEESSSTHYGNPIRRQSSFQSSSQDNFPLKVNILDHSQFIDTVCGLLKDYWRINCKQTHKVSSAGVNTDFYRDENNNTSMEICKCVPTSSKKYFSSMICTDQVDKYLAKCSNKLISRLSSSTLKEQKVNYCAPDCPQQYVTNCPALAQHIQTKRFLPRQKNITTCQRLCTECKELVESSKTPKADGNNDIIIIKIERLKLTKNCSLLRDPDVHQLYVEFTFLGYSGLDLETISVAKPESHTEVMRFNYIRKFLIDEEKHAKQRNQLRDILAGDSDPIVQFNVVSEPLREEMDVKDCVEVGCAYLDLRKQILYNSHDNISLLVVNINGKDAIGTLKITFHGLNNIRKNLPKFLPINGSP